MGLGRLHRSPPSESRAWAEGGEEKQSQEQKLKGRSGAGGRKAQTALCKVGTSVGLEGAAWREQGWLVFVSLIGYHPTT